MKKILLNIILITFLFLTVQAQEQALHDPILLAVPSMQEVVDLAMEHSPLLKSKKIDIEIAENEIKNEKRKWADYFYLDGNMGYGRYNRILLSDAITEDEASSGLLLQGEQIQYYGGVALKLPLSGIYNRNNKIKIKKLEVEKAELQITELKNQIYQVIITEYYQLKYLEESIETYTETYHTLQISYENAQNELKAGKMDLNNFAILVSSVGKAKNLLMQAKNSYYAQYKKLEKISGIKFGKNDGL